MLNVRVSPLPSAAKGLKRQTPAAMTVVGGAPRISGSTLAAVCTAMLKAGSAAVAVPSLAEMN
jgi:hypothetical protein